MTTNRTTHSRLLAALVAGGLLFAACGDDDGAGVREIGGEDGSGSGSASGSGSGSGVASGSDSAGSVEADGGYDYASDVSIHRQVVNDVCEINTLLDEDTIDFDAVEAVYVDGGNSVNSDGSVRTLAGFATAEGRLHGFDEYYDSATALDDYVTDAIEGAGAFDDEDDAVRRQAVQKGVQNQIMIAWTVHELRSALEKADAGEFDADEGAPHNWDEAWAFYHGAESACAPYATADKRAENFGTMADDGETALVNEAILAAMIEGRDALLAEDAAGAQAAADEVLRNVVITYAQAAIRYATVIEDDLAADDAESARVHQAEGHAFFRVIEPIVADAGADVDAIEEILVLDAEPGANGNGDDVRQALQPALDEFGITDADIGELQER